MRLYELEDILVGNICIYHPGGSKAYFGKLRYCPTALKQREIKHIHSGVERYCEVIVQ